MSKLILSLNDKVIAEYPLDKEVVSIGRRPDNDIQIDNLAISGHHAKITTILDESYIEDLGSTNGIYINGKRCKKQTLREGDKVTIGKHTLRFQLESLPSGMVSSTHKPAVKKQFTADTPHLQILSGNGVGKKIILTKRLTTVGMPGMQVGAITHRSSGYFFLNIDAGSSEHPPMVNGEPVGNKARALQDHDVIEVAGIRMEFFSA
jgi:ribosome-associated protein YbcJ (S4-like RNA binding protein)